MFQAHTQKNRYGLFAQVDAGSYPLQLLFDTKEERDEEYNRLLTGEGIISCHYPDEMFPVRVIKFDMDAVFHFIPPAEDDEDSDSDEPDYAKL